MGRWEIWIQFIWTGFALKVPSSWTCPERPPQGEASGHCDQRLNHSLWSSSGSRESLQYLYRFCTDPLTLEAHFNFLSYYKNSSPSVYQHNPAFSACIVLTSVGCFTSICKPSQGGLFWYWMVWWHIIITLNFCFFLSYFSIFLFLAADSQYNYQQGFFHLLDEIQVSE